MRKSIQINNDWYFKDNFNEKYINLKEFSDFKPVSLPHTNIELPLNYFDKTVYQFVSCYIRRIKIENVWLSKRLFLEFEGVMAYGEVFVNGHLANCHKGGYTGFTVEITNYINEGENYIVVKVDSTERSDIPPFGSSIDFLTFGGIYRDVNLIITDKAYINDVFIYCINPLSSNKRVCIEVEVNSLADEIIDKIDIDITYAGNTYAGYSKKICCMSGITKHKIAIDNINNVQLWDVDNPVSYTIKIEITGKGCKDLIQTKFGFRDARFTAEGFYLNGRKLKLIGLNRHQSYPYVGYAMPKRVQQKDADILKQELGLNIVRTSHYVHSRHFLDRCDEIGLLVFEEMPGWQYLGNEEWKKTALKNVEEMICRDRNRPSIVLWGVRINESKDDHEFYTETNSLARMLDPTRQTGGVRCDEGSELLEDVYTMNDFFYDGSNDIIRTQSKATRLKADVPYLITEFAGHMYPTKSYDQEERLIEHALRHMVVHNAVNMEENISGAIGWCAFDYNTQSNFGSGDKICYHGVMDIFRIPKFAAYFYKSQKDPKMEIILEAATRWAYGDRNAGGIFPLIIFTNCEYVELFLNGKTQGKYHPRFDNYKGLKYPPVLIDDIKTFWGESWSDGEISGYIGEKMVKTKKFLHNPVPAVLSVVPDDKVILADGSDATRVVIKALDHVGNILPFYFSPIQIRVNGAAYLSGPETVSLQGGVYAFWIRSNGHEGNINIKVSEERLGEIQLNLVALRDLILNMH